LFCIALKGNKATPPQQKKTAPRKTNHGLGSKKIENESNDKRKGRLKLQALKNGKAKPEKKHKSEKDITRRGGREAWSPAKEKIYQKRASENGP